MDLKEAIGRLKELGDPAIVEKKAKKWAVHAVKTLGIHHKELKVLAKEIGRDDSLGRALIESDIYEAKLLASKIISPESITDSEMEEWVLFFDNWEICDSFSMALFARSSLAHKKITAWYIREEEYVKRAAFATLAGYTMADKLAENEKFTRYYPLIKSACTDQRTYVKKAVNWALRSIGKRNPDLRESALQLSYEILEIDNKAAKWIAKDAIKELEKDNVRLSNYPRSVYG